MGRQSTSKVDESERIVEMNSFTPEIESVESQTFVIDEDGLVVMEQDPSPAIMCRREDWFSGLAVLIVGFILCMVTLPANAMMMDSGTGEAMVAAMIGVTASLLCFIGGIFGCVTTFGWRSLIPGFAAQIFMFVLGFFFALIT